MERDYAKLSVYRSVGSVESWLNQRARWRDLTWSNRGVESFIEALTETWWRIWRDRGRYRSYGLMMVLRVEGRRALDGIPASFEPCVHDVSLESQVLVANQICVGGL